MPLAMTTRETVRFHMMNVATGNVGSADWSGMDFHGNL